MTVFTTLSSAIITIVQYAGLWQGEQRNTKHILAILAMICYFFCYTLQLIALFLSKDDITRLFECFSVISFCGMGILKLLSLSRGNHLWLKILDKMLLLEKSQLRCDEVNIVEYESEDEVENRDLGGLIGNYSEKFKTTSTILRKIYSFTCIIFIFSPFVEYAFWSLQGIEQEGYPHILPSWNLFDGVHFSCYILIAICEAVAAIYCVSIHLAFDSTVIGVMIFVCGQFTSLFYQSGRIGGKGRICNLSRRRDMRAHCRIIKCHRIHAQLVSILYELDDQIKNILGVYFFVATLTLCSVAVRLTSEDMSVMQLASLLQYMCATLIQLYIYCSYGDAVFNESSINAGQGPYGSAIWCLSPKTRREIAILGFGMMKPRRLHAGPFNSLDLPSFIQIVRTAYSYYALLGNSNSKQN